MTPEDARLLGDLLRQEQQAQYDELYKSLSGAQLAPPPPADAPQPEEDPRNMYDVLLGSDPGVTESEIYAAYLDRLQQLERDQATDIGASPELLEQQRQDLRDEYLRTSVDATGQNVGRFARSDLLLNTDGYVLGDDGKPRKASGPEILYNSIMRQAIARGPEFEREVLRLQKEREEEYLAAREEGLSAEEATRRVQPLTERLIQKVNYDTRTIDESLFMAGVRGIFGLFASGVTETLFDELPLFYEVDAAGDLQNPDDPMDQLAYYLGQVRELSETPLVDTPFGPVSVGGLLQSLSPAELVGTPYETMYSGAEKVYQAVAGEDADLAKGVRRTIEKLPGGDLVGWVPYYGLRSMQKGADLIPRPFVAIDRDAPMPDDERGRKVAAETGSFLGDWGMAVARGRDYYTDLLSIPAYRETLGEDYRLALLPAFLMEAVTPLAPMKSAGKVFDYVNEAMQGALSAASPAAWGRAFAQQKAFMDLLAEGGEQMAETATAFDVLRTQGSVLHQAADKLSNELTTPTALYAGLGSLTSDQIGGLARQSKSAQHLLYRAEQVGLDQAYYDWRIGLEVQSIAGKVAQLGTTQPEDALKLLTEMVQDGAGLEAARYLAASDLYAPALKAAADGDIIQAFANFKGAAKRAGSMGINSLNPRVRQVLRVMDQVSDGRSLEDIASSPVQLLAPYLTRVRKAGKLDELFAGVTPAVRTSMEVAAGLNRMGRLALQDLLHDIIPRNLEMVTKRVAIPREMNTPQVMQQVGTIERMLLKADRIKVDGAPARQVTSNRERLRNLFREVLPGVGRRGEWLARSPMYRDIDAALAGEGVLTPTQFEVLADTVREAGYRQVMGEAVVTPAFGGREFELAQRPTAIVRGERVARRVAASDVWRPLLEGVVGALEGTRRAIAPRVPTASVPAANMGAARGFVAAKMQQPVEAMQRWLRSGSPNMPAPMKQLLDSIANTMGVVRRKFDKEADDARRAATRAGSDTPGPDALNGMVMRRWAEIGARSDRKLDETVARLRREHELALERNPRAVMPSDAELAWLFVYRSGGREVNVGRRMRAIATMGETEQKMMYQAARLWLRRSAYKQQWRNILSDFFGAHHRTARSTKVVEEIHEQVMRYVDGALAESVLVTNEARQLQRGIDAARKSLETMKDGPQARALVAEIYSMLDELAGAKYEVPTVEGMQNVIQRVKDFGGKQLSDRGAARLTITGFHDAAFEASTSWALGFDQQKAVTRLVNQMADQHPEMVANLAPVEGARGWAQSTVARIYTPVDTVQNVIRNMYALAMNARPNEADRLTKLYDEAVRRLQTPGPASGSGQRPPRPRYSHDPQLPKYIRTRLRAAEESAVAAQQDLVRTIDELSQTAAEVRYDAPLGTLPALPTATGDVLRAKTLREAGPEAIEEARVELGKLTRERAKVRRQRDEVRNKLSATRKKRKKRKFKDDEKEAVFDSTVRILQADVESLSDQYDNLSRLMREQNTIISEAAKGLKTRQVQLGRKAKRISKLKEQKTRAEARVEKTRRRVEAAQIAAEQYRLDNQILTREQTGVDQILRYVDIRMNSLGDDELAEIAKSALDMISARQSLHIPARTVVSLRSAGETKGSLGALSAVGQSIRDMRLMKPTGDALHDALVEFGKVIPEQKLVDTVTNTISSTVDEAINGYVVDQVAQTLRGYGLTSAAHGGAVEDIMRGIARIPERDLQVMPDMVGMNDAIKQIQGAARNGKLLNTLTNLQKRNALSQVEREVVGNIGAYTRFGLDVAATALSLSRTYASYGLLAGGIIFGVAGLPIPVPFVSRYIGLNSLTAPAIMLGTLGLPGVAKALGEVPAEIATAIRRGFGRNKNLVDTASPRLPDDIRFTDRYGKAWTVRETEALLEEWNWYMSRATVDQSADMMLTMQRDLRVMVGKEGLENLTWFPTLRQHLFSPRRTSIGMQFATGVDSVFRRSTFLSAIRDGQTPAQAAELARASVLDYGAVPDLIKQSVNRYMLFATFKMASYAEILRALARGDDAFLRVMRIQQRQHEAMNTWAFGEDYDRARMFMVPVGDVDYRPIIVGGPQDPFASNAMELIQMTGFLASMLPFTEDGGPLGQRAAKVLREQNLMPAAQLAVLAMTEANLTRGRLVPDVWVVRMQQAQYWDDFRDMFDIKPVPRPIFGGRDRRRPASGTFTRGAVQYEFSPEGYEKWVRAQLLATQLTAKRMTEDFTKGQISAGYFPEDYNPKYRSAVGFIPYNIGLATPLKGKRAQDLYERAWIQTQFLNR